MNIRTHGTVVWDKGGKSQQNFTEEGEGEVLKKMKGHNASPRKRVVKASLVHKDNATREQGMFGE